MGLYRGEKRKGERKYRNERECGESKHEREKEVRSVRCGVDLDLKLYSLLSLSVPTSLTPGRLQALQLSLPPHATPLSTTPSRSLLPPLLPSQEARQHEWQAGAGGGIWGLLAKRQTGAAPLESLKWQTLKRAGEGGRQRKMKTSPRMSRPQSSAHFSPFSFLSCLARKEVFPPFFFPVGAFYKFCSSV